MHHWSRLMMLNLFGALTACTAPPQVSPAAQAAADGWHDVHLPGKAHTRYSTEAKDGRHSIAAQSERSASLWRRKLAVQAQAVQEVSFSWWVQDLPLQASVADLEREDAAARVLFSFDGNMASLPLRTRAMFELAEALTGERPPYATLMYVWDATAPVGTVIINPRSDRIRKIVLDSGTAHLGHWRDHRRNLAQDFRRAFGEAPGNLTSMAVMADSDNTQSSARSWFGSIKLH